MVLWSGGGIEGGYKARERDGEVEGRCVLGDREEGHATGGRVERKKTGCWAGERDGGFIGKGRSLRWIRGIPFRACQTPKTGPNVMGRRGHSRFVLPQSCLWPSSVGESRERARGHLKVKRRKERSPPAALSPTLLPKTVVSSR